MAVAGLLVLMLSMVSSPVWGLTDPRDVYAIIQLYTFLGSPPLTGWIPGGDPCGPPSWQGVDCVNANITAIKLSGANLGGVVTEDLGSFASIILIDLSNNHIGGSIPSNLPITLRSLYLSGNQFSGRIPVTLSSLGQLTDLSLSNNQLSGPIPDAFQMLKGLLDMDLSGNNFSDVLPPSMGNLLVITTLHLQNNQLSGVLDVLQDLPLTDLNIENNLFSGPIPGKLLTIPNFRRDGNPFNTTVLPPPPTPAASPLSPSDAPSPYSGGGSPATPSPQTGKRETKITLKKILWIAITVLLVVVLVLVSCLCMLRCCRAAESSERNKLPEMATTDGVVPKTQKQDQYSQNPLFQVKKDSEKRDVAPAAGGSQTNKKPGKDHSIDMLSNPPASSLPFPLLPAKKIIANPTFTPVVRKENTSKTAEPARLFTIASLQQYTDSFSEENLIGKGTLGTVYRAELPDGKILAVKKLDNAASGHLSDREFLELVSSIAQFRHENVLGLVGYCLEHGQRLLVYSYCRNGTLGDALSSDYDVNKKLSWNGRLRLALQAAKALEYLHEACQPPTVHQNFMSCNVLLEDDLTVRVSDCGLALLLPPYSMAQLQSSGYGAPELELGAYTCHSDVYSFGVILLQLLTGRKSYDRSRPRGEQNLARWAFSRLYDIDALSRMVDPSLGSEYSTKSLSQVADIISLCIQPEPGFRPPMSEIVQRLVQLM